MASRVVLRCFVVSCLLSLAFGTPIPASSEADVSYMSFAELRNLSQTTDQQMMAVFGCRGQSCLIADTSGSTGRLPTMKAQGATDSDIACIVRHNPALGEMLRKYDYSPPDGPAQDVTGVSSLMSGINMGTFGSRESGSFDGTCATNILIFAKGTFEPGTYGVFIGPSFTSGLPSGWSTAGVDYDANVGGDYCLGLPGGMVAKDVINGAYKKCPNSNLFLSGYSQGAMVIRNGLARADPAAVAKVKGVVTFGDPFNGAPIKGYYGPISVQCNDSDGVCTGNFELRPGHLSYGGDTSASLGQAALLRMAAGWGDSWCCHPSTLPSLPNPAKWKESIRKNGGKIPKPIAGTSIEAWAQAVAYSNGEVPKYTDPTQGSAPINLGISGLLGGLFGRALGILE